MSFSERCTFTLKEQEMLDNMIKLIKSYYKEDRIEVIETYMKKIYTYFSKYDKDKLSEFGNQLAIFKVELALENDYLDIEYKPKFKLGEDKEFPLLIRNDEDCEKVVDYIVYETRKKLCKHYNLEEDSLEKHCIDTSFDLECICKENKVRYEHIGVDQKLDHGMFHHFTIIEVKKDDGEVKRYIADCTYRQFFTERDSYLERIGVMTYGPASGCSMGKYMVVDDKRKKVAEELLTKGYVEATEENLKYYFDSIIFSGRDLKYYKDNGLDYTNTSDIEVNNSFEYYKNLLLSNGVIKKDGILSSFVYDEKSKK